MQLHPKGVRDEATFRFVKLQGRLAMESLQYPAK